MLYIQHIRLSFNKNFRGMPYSAIRSRLKKAYVLPEIYDMKTESVNRIHYIYLLQDSNEIKTQIDRVDTIDDIYDIKILSGIKAVKREDEYDVYFKYEYSMGMPDRVLGKHSKTNCAINQNYGSLLSECAFSLNKGNYGRIVYNGRLTDYDTGEWYYSYDTINLFNTEIPLESRKIFEENEPSVTYSQLEVLF